MSRKILLRFTTCIQELGGSISKESISVSLLLLLLLSLPLLLTFIRVPLRTGTKRLGIFNKQILANTIPILRLVFRKFPTNLHSAVNILSSIIVKNPMVVPKTAFKKFEGKWSA